MMDKETETLAISKLVFELTVSSGFSTDLDALLERLFAVLGDHYDFPFEPRGAILLLNPRGKFFQVAQFGMEPFWKSDFHWDKDIFSSSSIGKDCLIQDSEILIPAPGADARQKQRLVILPLRIENTGVGYAVLFAPPGYQPDAIHLEFLTDLAHALSGMVNRALTLETLRVREVELEDARTDAIRSLGVAAEYRDNETGWHIMRMTNVAQAIAKAMGLSEAMRELLYIAAPMHDVGKIGIADAILLKPEKLSASEFEVMKTHTTIGVTILTGNDPLIEAAREIAGSHHERWDGGGYPQGLKGEQIPILARICSVADVFDALTSTRPYKKPWTVEEAAAWIGTQSGKHFDPIVVAAFQQAMPEILRIRELYRDDIIDPKQALSLPPVEHTQEGWVVWNNNLSVGIDAIDEHHRYLFDLVNDLYSVVSKKRGARNVARLIKALDAYAKVHFRAEESMMQHYHFDGIYRQESQHHDFEVRVQEFYQELHANPLVAQFDILLYLRAWLVNHIQVEDAKLRSLVEA
jgi:hemerythrin-like metal-binding protein